MLVKATTQLKATKLKKVSNHASKLQYNETATNELSTLTNFRNNPEIAAEISTNVTKHNMDMDESEKKKRTSEEASTTANESDPKKRKITTDLSQLKINGRCLADYQGAINEMMNKRRGNSPSKKKKYTKKELLKDTLRQAGSKAKDLDNWWNKHRKFFSSEVTLKGTSKEDMLEEILPIAFQALNENGDDTVVADIAKEQQKNPDDSV